MTGSCCGGAAPPSRRTFPAAPVGRCALLAVRLAVAATLALFLAGCSSIDEAQEARGHRSARPTPASPGQTFFAGADGVVVRDQPSAAAAVVGHLAPHERVSRVRVHDGYALVTGTASGVKGWVDNAQLIAHVPASSAAKEPSAPPTAASDPPAMSAHPDPGPPPVLLAPEADEPEPAAAKAPPAKPRPAASTSEMLDPF
ncbi:MAG: SH3 domain-containing protein [Burkholderiales bacterium]